MNGIFFPVPENLVIEVVWAMHHQYEPGYVHFAPQISAGFLWHLLEGEMQVDTPEASFRVETGQWVWHGVCGARRIEAGPRGAKWLTVGILARCGGRDWFSPPVPRLLSPPEDEAAYAKKLMLLLAQVHKGDSSRLEIDGLGRTLLGWLWRIGGNESRPHYPDWLQSALLRIEKQPGVSVSELATDAHFSPAQFRRLWERYLVTSPRDYLLGRRLEIARRLLENEEISVAEIANRSGFAGPSQLARAFSGRFGQSPLEWRRAAREKV